MIFVDRVSNAEEPCSHVGDLVERARVKRDAAAVVAEAARAVLREQTDHTRGSTLRWNERASAYERITA